MQKVKNQWLPDRTLSRIFTSAKLKIQFGGAAVKK
jgi:hypothetical protein